MKIFEIDRKVKVLCVIYFMVAQSSMMARATSDSFLLKYFESGSIPLMIMAAASLSIVLALFTTYLCGRFSGIRSYENSDNWNSCNASIYGLCCLFLWSQRRK